MRSTLGLLRCIVFPDSLECRRSSRKMEGWRSFVMVWQRHSDIRSACPCQSRTSQAVVSVTLGSPVAHPFPSREQSEAMRPPLPLASVLLLAWWLSLMALAGPSGCGPAPPDPANDESHARLAGTSPSQQAQASASTPTTQAASPPSLASDLAPAVHDEAPPSEPLIVPRWIAMALKSPDVQVRLHAVDRWGQQAPAGSLDPLLLAMEDEDERVQVRALALIEQDWVRGRMEEK